MDLRRAISNASLPQEGKGAVERLDIGFGNGPLTEACFEINPCELDYGVGHRMPQSLQ